MLKLAEDYYADYRRECERLGVTPPPPWDELSSGHKLGWGLAAYDFAMKMRQDNRSETP